MIDSTVQIPEATPTMVIPPIELRPEVPELRGAEPPAWLKRTLKWLFPVLALLFIALIAVPGFLQKWLWMRQLDYAGIVWTLFSVKRFSHPARVAVSGHQRIGTPLLLRG